MTMLMLFTVKCVQCMVINGLMKKMLGGQKFVSDMEVQWAIRQWLAQQPTSFFLQAYRAFTNLFKDGEKFK